MDTQFINPILGEPGLWLVTTLSGAYAMCDSGLNALQAAYRQSGKAESFLDSPNALRRVGTDKELNAEEIMAEWHHLGWPLPRKE